MSDEGPDIWLGLVDAVPIDPAASEIGGAFLHAAADAALLGHGFRVSDLDEAGSLRERLRTGESIAPELIVLALEAASAREARLGEFHAYPPDDHPDPEAFAEEGNETVAADLRTLAGARALVCVRGHHDWHDTVGYVAGVGTRWALIQIVNRHGLADGCLAVTLETISEIEPIDPEISYLPRVVAARPVATVAPVLDLDDTRALLEDAARQSAVIYLVADDLLPGAFWIGRIAALNDGGVVLRKVSPVGTWDGEVAYAYDSITRIGFGGRYEEALGLAADAGPA
jgi:hypothetical protein